MKKLMSVCLTLLMMTFSVAAMATTSVQITELETSTYVALDVDDLELATNGTKPPPVAPVEPDNEESWIDILTPLSITLATNGTKPPPVAPDSQSTKTPIKIPTIRPRQS